MQTFLPSSSFHHSALVLDKKRLNCQRKECGQIWKALTEEKYGWKNHPAVKQWVGYRYYFLCYWNEICVACDKRGIKDNLNVRDKVQKLIRSILDKNLELDRPDWLGNVNYHASHRSNLLRKDPAWYGQFGWKESPDLPYYWPSKIYE